jgi:hypothetical protein
MRMIWQAIRAVTVEVMGVGAVIFMLFGAAGWTAESAGVNTRSEIDRAVNWLQESTGKVLATLKPKLTAEQRQQFAAERLDHYGQIYGEAASSYAKRLQQQTPVSQDSALPTNQLLGTL